MIDWSAMTMSPIGLESGRVHASSSNFLNNPWPYFILGTLAVLVAIGGFLLALRVPNGMMTVHALSTVPMIGAVALLANGIRLLRSPREVVFGIPGLAVRSHRGDKLYAWDQIAWADTEQQLFSSGKALMIYGNDGKVLTKLPAGLERFDDLVSKVKARLTEQPSPHASAVRWRKSRRQAKLFLVMTILALAMSVFLAWVSYDEHRSRTLMRTQGVEGEGVVVRKFIAPDGRTNRIEFRVADAGENAKLHNVEIGRGLWNDLKTGERLPIKTVPGHPEIAKLQSGEVPSEVEPAPAMTALLAAAMFAGFVFFLVGAVLGFKGINIGFDPAKAKFKIERLPH
jgi:hypothetical protein